MATKFLEPGGDADFTKGSTNGFWLATDGGNPATDFVHGGHKRSLTHTGGVLISPTVLSSSGGRVSFYIYIKTLPSTTDPFLVLINSGQTQGSVEVKLTSAGILQLANWNDDAQIGSNGSTLSTGIWYRISLAWKITSTTVNEFRLFKNGTLDISVTNATISFTTTANFGITNFNDATFDFRSSDHYADDSNSLTDTGDIWVTVKRPNANGTNNQFTTQIGSGGSGYGSGHSPQVNERPISITNGWSVVTSLGTKTEEFNIESAATGDIDISTATIVDYLGWISAKISSGTETASIIVNGVSSNISVTTTITLFTKIAGSATYPAGTGTDIGVIAAAVAVTFSLYECGTIVAYIPPAAVLTPLTWQQPTEKPIFELTKVVSYTRNLIRTLKFL